MVIGNTNDTGESNSQQIPTPLETELARSTFDVERRLDCRLYRLCLRTATANGWQGFHCGGCSVRDPEPRAVLLSGDHGSEFHAPGRR